MATTVCNEHEITVRQFFNVVHRYTERMKIHVVTDAQALEDHMHEFYLTDDFYKTQEEADRVLKYYGDAPVWNLHIEMDYDRIPRENHAYYCLVPTIVANCHYNDIREGYLREKEDRRKAKKREYQKKYRERKNNSGKEVQS